MRKWAKSITAQSKALARLWIKAIVNQLKRQIKPETALKLLPLYPTSLPSEHETYIQALNMALKDKEIHNIALTGSYGSGKSSILKDFISNKKDSSILISFSTLGASLDSYTTKPDQSSENKLDSKANLIQKEIVKQILHREKYDNIPASRYPKISKISFRKTIYWALALTAAFPILFYALGKLTLTNFSAIRAATIMSLAFIAFFVVVRIVLSIFKRLQLEKLSGGPVSIALSNSNNYFDQYLDEIIYFFEATKYDLVILEDIDRFADLYIFENLRQLNNLLNNSKQVGKQIKFIYAVKDSMFSTENNAIDGNRTKFFDLIIPTVPFITYKNSRDVITDMFTPEYAIDKNVIAIVSRHITDMRLVKNIYNEFKIFNEKIIKNGKIPGLSPSNLFATIVFKNIYLKDFEELKNRGSKLDKIYDASTSFIQKTYRDLSIEANQLNRMMNGYNNIASRSKGYGLQLIALMQKKLDDQNAYFSSYTLSDASYTRSDDMMGQDFWIALSKTEPDSHILVNYQVKGNYYNRTLTISKSEIEQAINGKIESEVWLEQEMAPLKSQLTKAESAMSSIRNQSIKDLMHSHSEFNEQILAITGGGLLHELVLGGYIDANYALYTSIYREENVSANGMNFIVHNIQANKQDPSYKFNDDNEIKGVLNELDGAYFENRAIFNYDILAHLLRTKDSRANLILDMISSGTSEDIEFLDKFIASDNHADLLIAALAKQWSGLFSYLVANSSLSQDAKNHLIDIALLNGDTSVHYTTSHQISEYLSRYANRLENLQNNESKEYTATASELLAHFDVELLSLSGINNKDLLEFVESNNLYEINVSNIESLIGQKNLSLTNIKNHKARVFEHVGKHLDQYINILEESHETKHSVETSDDLVEVLNIGREQSTDILDMIIEAASDDCYVHNLNDVDPKTWSSLLKHARAINILPNALDYYNAKGKQVDTVLANYITDAENLTSNEIIEDQEEKRTFALSILDSDIKQEVKATIVADLGLEAYITPGQFKGHTGNLYGILVAKGVIEDTAETYNSLINLTWATKEAYISNSLKFDSYINEAKFSSDDLNAISKSTSIKPSVKKYLLDNIASYKDLLSTSSTSSFATYGLVNNYALNASNLSTILVGLDDETSVKLLCLSLDQLSKEDFLTILSAIGNDYAKLAQPNKRPSFEYNNENLVLAKRLQELGIVSSYENKKGKLRVNTRANF